MEIVLFLLVAAAVVALGVCAHKAEQKRVAALVAWTQAAGLRLVAQRKDDPAWPFELFRRGHSRYAQVLSEGALPGATPGIEGASILLFEYHWAVTTGSGKNRRTHHYWRTCALVELAVEVGHVSIEREGFGDKLAAVFGFDDIDFEDLEFSKRFKVQAGSKKDAWTLLDGALMTWLKAHPQCRIETQGARALVVLEEQGKASVARFLALKEWSAGFLAQLPRVLVNAQRAQLGHAPVMEAGNAAARSRKERN